MCHVHTGAYVSLLLAPMKPTTYAYRLPPKKDYHVYIARSTYNYAYARQTQVNVVKLSESVQLSFVGQDLQELSRETIGPYRLSNRQRADRLPYFVPRRDIVQWSARGALLKLVHNAQVKGQRLGVKKFVKPPHPPLADKGIIPQQSIFLVFDVLRVKRPPSFHSHPLEVVVDFKLITFSDTPFELANIILEKPLFTASARVRFSYLMIVFKARRRRQSFWRRTGLIFRVFSILPSCVEVRFQLLGCTPAFQYLFAPIRGRYVGRIRPQRLRN